MTPVEEKIQKLKEILAEMESVLVAYSGGTDSTFLLNTAQEVLGEKAIAITVKSEVHPLRDFKEACEFTKNMNIRHLSMRTTVLNNEHFLANTQEKCYHCKKILFNQLRHIADEHGLKWVINGYNATDEELYTLPIKACKELGLRSPLAEAELTEDEIRNLAPKMNLPNWDRPYIPCLASRIPFGHKITPEKLRQVDDAEEYLRGLGFKWARVYHHDSVARIEVLPKEAPKLLKKDNAEKITHMFREIGFAFTAADLLGYRPDENKQTQEKN